MLMPRKVRHRKQQRGRLTGLAKGGTRLAFGDYGIQAMEPGWLTNRQIEAARIAMTRYIKRGGKVWINVFPDKPVTQKPAETRMGSGKGNPEKWVAVVKPGSRALRAVGRPRARRARGDAPGDSQVAPARALHHTRGRGMTKPSELRELTDDTLADKLSEAKQELWKRRLDLATGELDSTSEITEYKREIARIRTLVREREIAAHEAQAEG